MLYECDCLLIGNRELFRENEGGWLYNTRCRNMNKIITVVEPYRLPSLMSKLARLSAMCDLAHEEG